MNLHYYLLIYFYKFLSPAFIVRVTVKLFFYFLSLYLHSAGQKHLRLPSLDASCHAWINYAALQWLTVKKSFGEATTTTTKAYGAQLIYKYLQKEAWKHPAWAGDAHGRHGEEHQGKRPREQGFFVVRFCFLLSKKTRTARKSSQFGIPTTATLD